MKDNPCIKIIGRWIFKTEVIRHTYERVNISKFMPCSDTFHVHYKCEKCGATKKEKFIEKDALIMQGVPIEELESIH